MVSPQAQDGTVPEGTPLERKLCLFAVARELVAVEASALLEVVSEPAVTPLPQVPRGLVGLMNHRGEILPVVDLGPWLGIPVVPRLQVMVVDGGRQQLGIAVDAIHDLLDLAPDSVEAAGKGADDTGLGEALAPLAGVPGPGGGDTHPWLVRPGVLIERLAETFATHPEAA